MEREPHRQIDIEALLVWAFREQRVEESHKAHPDAVTVYWAVLALPARHAGLICRHARQGTRPDWHPAPARARMVSLETARRARYVYTEWVRALMVLQRTLDGTLPQFTVTGPEHDDEPWTARYRA